MSVKKTPGGGEAEDSEKLPLRWAVILAVGGAVGVLVGRAAQGAIGTGGAVWAGVMGTVAVIGLLHAILR